MDGLRKELSALHEKSAELGEVRAALERKIKQLREAQGFLESETRKNSELSAALNRERTGYAAALEALRTEKNAAVGALQVLQSSREKRAIDADVQAALLARIQAQNTERGTLNKLFGLSEETSYKALLEVIQQLKQARTTEAPAVTSLSLADKVKSVFIAMEAGPYLYDDSKESFANVLTAAIQTRFNGDYAGEDLEGKIKEVIAEMDLVNFDISVDVKEGLPGQLAAALTQK